MTNLIKIDIDSSIAEINLNRPDKSNALNEELWFSLGDCFRELDENEDVRVCILSGLGENFSSGIDIKFLQSIGLEVDKITCEGRKRELLRKKILKLQEAFTQLEKCRKPIIAAVHGACIGGGLDLICACDMRFSTFDAFFQIKEIDFGFAADVGSLQRLPKLIPEGIVNELAYTGRQFSGEEANKLGLVNNCYADRKTMISSVRDIAKKIIKKSPLGIRGVKEILLHSRDNSVANSLKYVATWNAAMLISSDFEESFEAQLQNRSPKFRN